MEQKLWGVELVTVDDVLFRFVVMAPDPEDAVEEAAKALARNYNGIFKFWYCQGCYGVSGSAVELDCWHLKQ
jgi:hypothetical protein